MVLYFLGAKAASEGLIFFLRIFLDDWREKKRKEKKSSNQWEWMMMELPADEKKRKEIRVMQNEEIASFP